MAPRDIRLASILALLVITCPAAGKPATRSRRPAPRKPAAAKPAPVKPRVAVPAPKPGKPVLSAGARGPAGADSIEKAALQIPDLKTPENVSTVSGALQQVPGVRSAVVDLNTHLAVVDYDPSRTELDHFVLACREVGFEASEYRVELRFPKPIKLKGG